MAPPVLRTATSPFDSSRTTTMARTRCPKGVWCTGTMPTAVLAYQCGQGKHPACRVCGELYKPPASIPNGKSADAGSGTRNGNVSPFQNNSGNNRWRTQAKTLAEIQNEKMRELLKEKGVELPDDLKTETNDKEIQRLKDAVQTLKDMGCDYSEAQQKLDAALANKGNGRVGVKALMGKLQAAQNTLKQFVENHNKLHAQLRESYKKGEDQTELVQKLQKEVDQAMAEEGYTKKDDKKVDVPVEKPKDLNEEQQKQWDEALQAHEKECQAFEEQKKKGLQSKLETMLQNFEKAAPSPPPGNGAPVDVPDDKEEKGVKESSDEPMLGAKEDAAIVADQMDEDFAAQLAATSQKRNAEDGIDDKQSFANIAKAARKNAETSQANA